ncbi:hypothetical protein H072_5096 [Dactylellina haptotyla CBS 200.50]|uniref:CBM1 domain-containing protein n=1 Tax=Dactylellina haptotyla (strain CBS 200.50) TaxID=1284197 RepID=S8C095_DACHA|nr:hypothetical protein H072_5096 [Dactylellina haptotyla CBS 200.50]
MRFDLVQLWPLAILSQLVCSQQILWGQCGGIGYTGSTRCVATATCTSYNPYYYQCIPGPTQKSTTSSTTPIRTTTSSKTTSTTTKAMTTSSTTTKTTTRTTTSSSSSSTTKLTSASSTTSTKTSSTTSIKTSSTTSTKTSSTTGICATGTFTPVSASAAFASLMPGLNIGNTFDAIPDETSWGNTVTPANLDTIKSRGFKSIRLPVTWEYHLISQGPSWTINSTWLDRVEYIVDESLKRGLWTIVNIHHDSWISFDTGAANANYTLMNEKFSALWSQIGDRFKCKGERLLFEAINEPGGETQAHAQQLNTMMGLFMTSVNKAGGFNPKRVLVLNGLGMSMDKTEIWFQRPSIYPDQPWGLTFHYYGPYDFIFGAWGKTIWGTEDDKAAIEAEFKMWKGNFTDIPTFVGEWNASPKNVERAAGWRYYDAFTKLCNKYGFSHIIWDAGNDNLNRITNTWFEPASQSILMNAVAGNTNVLADSTLDGGATTQFSSAYIFHKVGDAVTDKTATYINTNGAPISVKTSTGVDLLASGQVGYSAGSTPSTGVLTVKQSYFATLIGSNTAPGVLETLNIAWGAGEELTLKIVLYKAPTVSNPTIPMQTSGDLHIPVQYAGLPFPAAVYGEYDDAARTYVSDDWTVWLGPLQKGRWVSGNWGYDSSSLILSESGLSNIRAKAPAGSTKAILAWEFFPRDGFAVGSNALNITITL